MQPALALAIQGKEIKGINGFREVALDFDGQTLWMATMASYYAKVTDARLCPTAPGKGNATTHKGTANACWDWFGSFPPDYPGSTNGQNSRGPSEHHSH